MPSPAGIFQQRQVALHPGFIPVPAVGRDAHDHDRINTVSSSSHFTESYCGRREGNITKKHQQRHFSAQLMEETTGHQIDAESPGS
ncbi:hypothetical protein ACLBOM_36625 [Escherichia coli]